MGLAKKRRDWSALEGKIVPPDGWEDWTPVERQLFCLVRGVTPPLSIRAIADELDLSLAEAVSMIDAREMRTSNPPARVPVGDFLRLIETAAKKILVAMDTAKVQDADLKALGSVFRELINSRALLLGEPTTIVGVDHRRAMNDVVQMMLAEAGRRGIGIVPDPHRPGAVLVRRPVVIDAQGRPG